MIPIDSIVSIKSGDEYGDEVLANIYKSRRHHKLDEWHTLCDRIESLPYSALITGTAV